MDNSDLMKIIGGNAWAKGGQTLTLSNGKTYFLDSVGKRLRNIDDPYDSIDIEQMLQMKETPEYPTLDVREDSIVMKCKCGKWMFVNPDWKKDNGPNRPSRAFRKG